MQYEANAETVMKKPLHPTIQALKNRAPAPPAPSEPLSAKMLRELAREAGADDLGFVALDRAELDDQRQDILAAFPATKSLLSYVVRMNREPIRSPARSIANLEFHKTGDLVNDIGHALVRALEDRGVPALNPAMGFPMEMDRFPEKVWVVSHKPVAVAAGLGMMGLHRNVIHPKFGNFILLGTILIAAEVSETNNPIAYNPCLDCKLCVAALPSRGDLSRRRFQLLRLLLAQLPGVHGRLHRLD
jgi:epoxyqueuosine reductase QueG